MSPNPRSLPPQELTAVVSVLAWMSLRTEKGSHRKAAKAIDVSTGAVQKAVGSREAGADVAGKLISWLFQRGIIAEHSMAGLMAVFSEDALTHWTWDRALSLAMPDQLRSAAKKLRKTSSITPSTLVRVVRGPTSPRLALEADLDEGSWVKLLGAAQKSPPPAAPRPEQLARWAIEDAAKAVEASAKTRAA